MVSSSRRSSFWRATLYLGISLGIGFGVLYQQRFLVHSIGGWEFVKEPLIRQLMRSDCFRRMERVDQSGPSFVFRSIGPFSRASHSLGVWQILKRQKTPLAEQAAGLLHDTSHTAFSHLADYLFAEKPQDAVTVGYQDSIHLHHLRKQHYESLLAQHGLTVEDLDPDKGVYKTLEQPLPDICADRLEYNLHTALVTHQMTRQEVQKVLQDAQFDGTNWFFTNPLLARQLGQLSLDYTRYFWASPTNVALNFHFAVIIRRALQKEVLTKDDLFTTDEAVLKKIQPLREDPFLKPFWDTCTTVGLQGQMTSPQKGTDIFPHKNPQYPYTTVHICPKFRGINPWVKTSKGLQRLTDIDPAFKAVFQETQAWCQKGYDIDIIDEATWATQVQ